MILEGNASFDKPDALLFGELESEISHILASSRICVIYDEMDSFRVPGFSETHLTENLDRQGSSAVLGHGHVGWQNSNLARKVDLSDPVSFDADDLLGKRRRVLLRIVGGKLVARRNGNCPY